MKNGMHAINVSLRPPQIRRLRMGENSLKGDDIAGRFIFCYLLFILAHLMHPSPLVPRETRRLTGEISKKIYSALKYTRYLLKPFRDECLQNCNAIAWARILANDFSRYGGFDIKSCACYDRIIQAH